MQKDKRIDIYIAACDPAARTILQRIRTILHQVVPDATETISYQMPAIRGNGILLYFAAFRHHIGIFPPVSGDERLVKALAPYRGPKGNLRFPLDEPIPFELITRIAKLRARQDGERGSRSKTTGTRTGRAGKKAAASSEARRAR